MAPLTISVDGVSKTHLLAERCILNIAVSCQDATQENASDKVTKTSKELQELFRPLSSKTDEGIPPATTPDSIFSMIRFSTSNYIPEDRDGNPLPAIYQARFHFEATISDFDKLAEITSALITKPLVSIVNTNWRLTDETKDRADAEARKAALQDAIRKANEYADMLQVPRTCVRVTDITESNSEVWRQQKTRKPGMDFVKPAGKGFAIEPEEVEIIHKLSVKFVADNTEK